MEVTEYSVNFSISVDLLKLKKYSKIQWNYWNYQMNEISVEFTHMNNHWKAYGFSI